MLSQRGFIFSAITTSSFFRVQTQIVNLLKRVTIMLLAYMIILLNT